MSTKPPSKKKTTVDFSVKLSRPDHAKLFFDALFCNICTCLHCFLRAMTDTLTRESCSDLGHTIPILERTSDNASTITDDDEDFGQVRKMSPWSELSICTEDDTDIMTDFRDQKRELAKKRATEFEQHIALFFDKNMKHKNIGNVLLADPELSVLTEYLAYFMAVEATNFANAESHRVPIYTKLIYLIKKWVSFLCLCPTTLVLAITYARRFATRIVPISEKRIAIHRNNVYQIVYLCLMTAHQVVNDLPYTLSDWYKVYATYGNNDIHAIRFAHPHGYVEQSPLQVFNTLQREFLSVMQYNFLVTPTQFHTELVEMFMAATIVPGTLEYARRDKSAPGTTWDMSVILNAEPCALGITV